MQDTGSDVWRRAGHIFTGMEDLYLGFFLNLVPGAQDLFVGVEDLSPVQWHPFTSRAGPEPHTLLAHVKGYGPWTQVRLSCAACLGRLGVQAAHL